jgi:putative ABC transport system permease protein
MQDLRHALRRLGRAPFASLVAIATLGLGIGATTALFSALHGVVLRPFPFRDPGRLVMLFETHAKRGSDRFEVSWPNYEAWRERARSFVDLAAMPNAVSDGFIIEGRETPRRLKGSLVSGNFFDVLGTAPSLGRTFSADEGRVGGPRGVVLSHGVWHSLLGADAKVVGRPLTINGTPTTVIGVMPKDFDFPRGAQLWVAAATTVPELVENRSVGFLHVLGRLKDGADPAGARAEIDTLVRDLARQYGTNEDGRGANLVPLADYLLGPTRPALLALFGVVGLVLLIACANVAHLLLAQGIERRRETAVRLSLGAPRAHLVRQHLVESLLLAGLGSGVGLLIAAWGVRWLAALAPEEIPRANEIGVDPTVLAFSLVLCVATALLCGLLPALEATRPDVVEALRDGSRGATRGPAARRFESTLVALQAAFAVVVLAGAALFARSLLALENVPLGFDPATRSFNVGLPDWKYPTPEAKRAFHHALVERVRSVPGVEAAAATFLRPLELAGIGVNSWIVLEGEGPEAQNRNPSVNYQVVTPGYFRAMGTRLVRGRDFAETDAAEAPGVVIVGEGTARRFWPGRDPIGQRLAVYGAATDAKGGYVWQSVVGVAEDVRHRQVREPALDVYVPSEQSVFTAEYLVVKSPLETGALAAQVRREIAALDKDQPSDALALARFVARAQGGARFRAILIVCFAALAAALAGIGLYGVMAHAVGRRVPEIGVRMALGARSRDILGLVLSVGLRPVAAGLLVGLVGAIAFGQAAQSLLFGVTPADPAALATGVAALVLVALAGGALPARHAAHVDPVTALRQ